MSSAIQTIRQARALTDSIFRIVREDCYYRRPIPRRHRLIFYLGHVEAFDWNHIAVWDRSEPSLHPSFDRLFEAGIDPPDGDLPQDTEADWPSVQDVLTYSKRVRARLDELIPLASPDVVQMAMEHRLMHAETVAYILHAMAPEEKLASGTQASGRGVESSVPHDGAGAPPVEVPAGKATLGRNRGTGFGWDNEFCECTVQVPAFVIDRHKVTNRDYLRFVEAGGPVPHYWDRRAGQWYWRGMFDIIPLPDDGPVFVTQQQAVAYAKWTGKRLPTEAEFHRAAYGTPHGVEREYPWGDHEPTAEHGNFGSQRWDPAPVTSYTGGVSAFGVEQMVGNGWEWTSTAFAPFPGFAPAPNYPGYSADFFDGNHFVLKGASPRTDTRLLRRSLRNWFRPDYPYVYGAFRCVEES